MDSSTRLRLSSRRMRWILLLFDFRGRIGRATWWVSGLIWGVVWTAAEAYRPSIEPPALGKWLLVAIVGTGVLSVFALGIKRLHDRDRSGWWLPLFYVVPGLSYGVADAFGPVDNAELAVAFYAVGIATGLCGLVELGLLPGTVGPNR